MPSKILDEVNDTITEVSKLLIISAILTQKKSQNWKEAKTLYQVLYASRVNRHGSFGEIQDIQGRSPFKEMKVKQIKM